MQYGTNTQDAFCNVKTNDVFLCDIITIVRRFNQNLVMESEYNESCAKWSQTSLSVNI